MTESCRLITTEQYQEYLKLKEEHKPLSWEELKEEAKKTNIYWNICSNITGTAEWITDHCWCFDKDGTVMFNGEVVAHDRTPSQMFAIMKALQ